MFQPLDGPSIQGKLSVDNITVVEAKVGASAFEDRKAVTIQPSGKLKVYFGGDGATPSAATVSSDGFNHFKDAKETYEAGFQQKIYLLSDSGTIEVLIAERA